MGMGVWDYRVRLLLAGSCVVLGSASPVDFTPCVFISSGLDRDR